MTECRPQFSIIFSVVQDRCDHHVGELAGKVLSHVGLHNFHVFDLDGLGDTGTLLSIIHMVTREKMLEDCRTFMFADVHCCTALKHDL